MVQYEPLLFDIETTGFNPMVEVWQSWKQTSRVTAISMVHLTEEEGEMSVNGRATFINRGGEEYEIIEEATGFARNVVTRAEGRDKEVFVAGWNIRSFDCAYLGARCGRLRLGGYPFTHGKFRLSMDRPLELPPEVDMVEMEGSNRKYPKQDDYARYLGIEFNQELDGSDMPDAFENGEYHKIEEHVEDDVDVMVEIFKREKEAMYEHLYRHYDERIHGDPPQFNDSVEL